MKQHTPLLAAAALLLAFTAACSTSTYRQAPDGSVTYHSGNLLDKSDFDMSAMLGQAQGSATMTLQEPVLDGAGNPIAITTSSFEFPPGSVLRVTKGADRTEVAKDGIRVWGAVESFKTWVRGDVAKATEAEKTTREGIRQAGETDRAGIDAVKSLGNNPEGAGTSVINAAGNAVR